MGNVVKPYRNRKLPLIMNLDLLKSFGNFRSGKEVDFLDTTKFLSNFKKEGNIDLKNYSIVYFNQWKKEKSPKDKNGNSFYADTSLQFILKKGENYAGVSGFEFVDKDTILISQIQGICGKYLANLKWSNALVSVVSEWASQKDLSEVLILPSKRNYWDAVNGERNYPRKDTYAKKHYDVSAEELGFTYDSNRQVFVKELKNNLEMVLN